MNFRFFVIALEKILATTSGTCCVGDQVIFKHFFNDIELKYHLFFKVSFADCCLVPQIDSARRLKRYLTLFHINLRKQLKEDETSFFLNRFDVDLEMFPNIIKVEKNLENLEPFLKAHARNQPDFPPE